MDALRDKITEQVPLGPVHVRNCRCHGDDDPAATHHGVGVHDGSWYAPECISLARSAHAERRSRVDRILDLVADVADLGGQA